MSLDVRYATYHRTHVFLAPKCSVQHRCGIERVESEDYHSHVLAQLQRLRGRIYLQDGAIRPSDLTIDGRHVVDVDEKSWHLATVSPTGDLLGCARFHCHPGTVSYSKLGLTASPIAKSVEWGTKLRNSISSQLEQTRKAGLSYLELGGWALAEELRNTTEALTYVLASFAWSRNIGGALGVTTATVRNGSAGILRRMGGQSLTWEGEEIPPYYDRRYNCGMELLRFDSRNPNPKYLPTIEALQQEILRVPVIYPKPQRDQQPAYEAPETSPWFVRQEETAKVFLEA